MKTVLKLKPKYVVLNVGINDSVDNISDDILNNLSMLKRYIKKVMPFCEVRAFHCPQLGSTIKKQIKFTKHTRHKIQVARQLKY